MTRISRFLVTRAIGLASVSAVLTNQTVNARPGVPSPTRQMRSPSASTVTPRTARVASPKAGDLPDVVVDWVRVFLPNPRSGQTVTFTSQVRNVGTAPTPAGVPIGVGYLIDGTQVTWGVVDGPLAAGASVTVGTNGDRWTATAGSHTLTAVADDINRFAESNENNNDQSISFVTAASGRVFFIPGTGDSWWYRVPLISGVWDDPSWEVHVIPSFASEGDQSAGLIQWLNMGGVTAPDIYDPNNLRWKAAWEQAQQLNKKYSFTLNDRVIGYSAGALVAQAIVYQFATVGETFGAPIGWHPWYYQGGPVWPETSLASQYGTFGGSPDIGVWRQEPWTDGRYILHHAKECDPVVQTQGNANPWYVIGLPCHYYDSGIFLTLGTYDHGTPGKYYEIGATEDPAEPTANPPVIGGGKWLVQTTWRHCQARTRYVPYDGNGNPIWGLATEWIPDLSQPNSKGCQVTATNDIEIPGGGQRATRVLQHKWEKGTQYERPVTFKSDGLPNWRAASSAWNATGRENRYPINGNRGVLCPNQKSRPNLVSGNVVTDNAIVEDRNGTITEGLWLSTNQGFSRTILRDGNGWPRWDAAECWTGPFTPDSLILPGPEYGVSSAPYSQVAFVKPDRSGIIQGYWRSGNLNTEFGFAREVPFTPDGTINWNAPGPWSNPISDDALGSGGGWNLIRAQSAFSFWR